MSLEKSLVKYASAPWGTYSPNVFGDDERIVQYPDDLKVGDVLLLWGGEDIATEMYGEPAVHTWSDEMSRRDTLEKNLFVRNAELGNLTVGVCRGAQLVCAVSGGKLFQHIEHPGQHLMECDDGIMRWSNSVHHQMMRPEGTDHHMIAWTRQLSPVHLTADGDVKTEIEPEVVYFKKTRALAIQGHPEFVNKGHPFRKWSRELVERFL